VTTIITLLFAWVLFVFTFIHSSARFRFACIASGLMYCLLLLTTDDNYHDYNAWFSFYINVSALWVVTLLALGMRLASVGIMAGIGLCLYVAPYHLANHPFFYGWYELNYIVLHTAFVASITVLPYTHPRQFGIVEKPRKKGSFLALFTGRDEPLSYL
jgi:hypothetical protein